MKDLRQLREEIDKIDAQLIPLFEKRMNVAIQVAEYKRANNTPVLQSGRENQVIENAINNLKDKMFSGEAKDFMMAVMDLSKCVQIKNTPVNIINQTRKPINYNAKVGYQGTEGSYSSQAASEFFAGNKNLVAYSHFESIFEAISKGKLDYGVVPLENSSIGSVVEVYDLLSKYDCYIVGEHWIKICHNLLGVKGAELKDIKKVYSKAEALEQSGDYLRSHDWDLVPYANTALAAKMVAQKQDKSLGAVASSQACELFGLQILQKEINTEKDNYTRFIVIAKELADIVANKVSISFTTPDEAGVLYSVLRFFARYNINMAKIESRPQKKSPGRYYFVVDLEGNCQSRDMQEALYFVESVTSEFKILGEYIKCDPTDR